MRQIKIDPPQLAAACDAHFQAIASYMKRKTQTYLESLFNSVTDALPYEKDFASCFAENDWGWLKQFLLADVDTLRKLAKREDLLKFTEFKDLYRIHFSNGADKYIDNAKKYNAYSFLQNLGLSICPYCDEEYLDILKKPEGKSVRTLELDHFYPKSKYPGLALCFFNLIPSGQACNGLKLEKPLGMNPYETDIEACTSLYPDLPVGINMESVSPEQCTIRFHPKAAMQLNLDTLLLEQRYEKHKATAHHYLTIMQQYPLSKVEEMTNAGFFPSVEYAYKILYAEPLTEDAKPQILGKLKQDITGRE